MSAFPANIRVNFICEVLRKRQQEQNTQSLSQPNLRQWKKRHQHLCSQGLRKRCLRQQIKHRRQFSQRRLHLQKQSTKFAPMRIAYTTTFASTRKEPTMFAPTRFAPTRTAVEPTLFAWFCASKNIADKVCAIVNRAQNLRQQELRQRHLRQLQLRQFEEHNICVNKECASETCMLLLYYTERLLQHKYKFTQAMRQLHKRGVNKKVRTTFALRKIAPQMRQQNLRQLNLSQRQLSQ